MSDDPNLLNTAGQGYSASFGSAQIPASDTMDAVKPETDDTVIKDITTESFVSDVIEASKDRVVLVDFWAPWCGPCKQLGPMLEKIVSAAGGTVALAKMDIDKYPEIAGQMGIKSIPAVAAFVDGKPVDAFMGAVPESQITAFIDKLPAPANPTAPPVNGVTTAMKKAEQLLAAGDSAQAAEVYAAVLGEEPGNLDAIAGLGECYLAVEELELARNVISSLPEEQASMPVISALIAKLELAEQTASIGPLADLEKKVQSNPADHQARFDLALAFNAGNKREKAAEQLLEIVRKDRKWKDDGAREQLLQFFEVWGAKDSATHTGRRGLSAILFS